VKQYWLIFKLQFAQFSSYRINVLAQILQSFVTPALTLIALSLASPKTSLNTSSLLIYYLFISLTYPIAVSTIDENISEMANSGQVNNFLIKPLSFFRWLLAINIAEKLVILITLLPILVPLVLLTHIELVKISEIVLVLCISFLLSFSLSYLFGQFNFWVDDFWAVQNLKHVAILFLGGVVLPYAFYPQSLVQFLKYTPFPYLASWPARIVQSQFNYSETIIAFIWILILYFLAHHLHRRAVLKYSFTNT